MLIFLEESTNSEYFVSQKHLILTDSPINESISRVTQFEMLSRILAMTV